MFGHNDNQQQTDPGQASMDDHAAAATAPAVNPEPVADGSLGTVTPVTSNNDVDLQLPSSSGPTVGPPPADDTAASAAPPSVGAAPDELLEIKQDALQQLSPLVGHLDQTPEERFRTTMMMIQATDDHTKIKEAYDAAKQIPDDKTRAQALLDVVNEINYFTQQNQDNNQQ